ncbi:MAG: LacI family DNA-binding transcriptional regulator, partial [Candidatus Sumerlaeota bacterium]
MSSQKGVTLSDVAKLCGVSKATVSAVLNPRSRSNIGFSEQTEKKVRLAAKKLGYRPNRTVRQFFSNRHGSIGLLFPGIYDIPKDTLGYLLKLAKWQDVMLLLEELSVQSEDTPKLIEEDCVDGLVVFGNAGGQWYENLGKLDIPVVEMNTNRRTGPMCITYDEENGSRLLVDRLAERGCKRIL